MWKIVCLPKTLIVIDLAAIVFGQFSFLIIGKQLSNVDMHDLKFFLYINDVKVFKMVLTASMCVAPHIMSMI